MAYESPCSLIPVMLARVATIGELSDRNSFAENYLNPALESGLVERIILGKPRSRNQKYRRTWK